MSAQYRPYRDEESVDGLEAASWTDNEPGSVQIYEKTTEELPFSSSNKRAFWTQIALFISIGILGFLLGYYAPFHPTITNVTLSSNDDSESSEHFDFYYSHVDSTIKDKLLSNINGSSILRLLTNYKDTNRIPGSDSDHKFALEVQKLLIDYGLDRVTHTNYSFNTMLPKKASVVKLLDKDNKTLFSNIDLEPNLHDDMRPFLPLSQASGIVITTNQLLYVNRGAKEDYETLLNLGHSSNETSGKVLVIRQTYYKAHDIVIAAQENGAKAVLLFPDPEIYHESSPFPKNVQLPEDAGRSQPTAWSNYGDIAYYNLSILSGIDPSKLGLDKDPKISIPVIPISFLTAKTILRGLSGPQAPRDWNCFSFTLYIGPTYKEETTLDSRDKISIEFYNQETDIVTSTITATLIGSSEPDRYVIIGSRRDSLNRGILDSVSGTAVMLEIARAFGLLKKQGWSPKRTIIFNSFGAESLNLIGSSYWLEQHQRLIHSRAIAYINCDQVVTGNNSVAIAASPLMYQVLYNATKQVDNPNRETKDHHLKSVYDAWEEYHHLEKNIEDISEKNSRHQLDKIMDEYKMELKLFKTGDTKTDEEDDSFGMPGSILEEFRKSATRKFRPKVRQPDLQSIYSPFFLYAGIPVVDVRYSGFKGVSNKTSILLEDTVPIIGTKYDNMDNVQLIDPHLKYHVTVAKVLSEILRDLSDSVFLPFNLLDYATTLQDNFDHFVSKYRTSLSEVELDSLKEVVQDFIRESIKFHHRQDLVNVRDAIKVRKFNDQLMLLERAFLDSNPVPNYWDRKHIILTPHEGQDHNGGFPGLVDWITLLEGESLDPTDFKLFVDVLKVQYKLLVSTISNAIKIIDEVYIL